MADRPSFIVHWKDHLRDDDSHYSGSDELLAYGADLSKATGIERIGVWLDIVPPGRRTSWPHAHELVEELVLVVEGAPHVWIDGHLHALTPGDAVGFPAGTGIAHTFMNNADAPAHLMVIGDRTEEDRIFYPKHPKRNEEMREMGRLWEGHPVRALGPHDGMAGNAAGGAAGETVERPPFILRWEEIVGPDENHYPGSDEMIGFGSDLTTPLGLARIGAGVDVIPPGRRSGWPHAHREEEELIFILEGTPEAWIDGETYPLRPGDAVGFPAGTGIAHTFLNNSDTDVRYVVLGERQKHYAPVHYPLYPARNEQIGDRHWKDAPARTLGPHDGKPDGLGENET